MKLGAKVMYSNKIQFLTGKDSEIHEIIEIVEAPDHKSFDEKGFHQMKVSVVWESFSGIPIPEKTKYTDTESDSKRKLVKLEDGNWIDPYWLREVE